MNLRMQALEDLQLWFGNIEDEGKNPETDSCTLCIEFDEDSSFLDCVRWCLKKKFITGSINEDEPLSWDAHNIFAVLNFDIQFTLAGIEKVPEIKQNGKQTT